MKKGEKKIVPPPPARILSEFGLMYFTLNGAPITKKNSPRIVRFGTGPKAFNRLLPSEQWCAYEARQKAFLVEYLAEFAAFMPINYPVQVRALFYFFGNEGDLTGYKDGLGDLLQAAGILADDKFIESWDGSRKLKDNAAPRVEVEITRFGAAQESLAL
jgi:Holliday junction resolvase RusA-like endonuclease